ncbi:MAG: tyrosine-type recombinase/integrase [Chloroflexota bacterium]
MTMKAEAISRILEREGVTREELEEAIRDAVTEAAAGTLKISGSLTPDLTIELVQDSPSRPDPVDTRELIEKYLESRKGGISEGSLTSYRNALNVFARYYPELPGRPEEIEKYLSRFKESRSAASVYTVIKLLYEFAERRHGVRNVMKLVQRPRFKNKDVFSLSLDEAKSVIDNCRDSRETALVHLYLGHGLRCDEAVRMNIGDIGDGQMLVRGKMRTEYIPLLQETKDILLEFAGGCGPDDPVFVSRQDNRLHHKQAYNIVKGILKRAGLLKNRSADSRIATHTLRKTFSTLAYHAGRDSRAIEALLRHKKGDVTSRYIGMPMGDLGKYLERYSPIRLINGHSQYGVAESIA